MEIKKDNKPTQIHLPPLLQTPIQIRIVDLIPGTEINKKFQYSYKIHGRVHSLLCIINIYIQRHIMRSIQTLHLLLGLLLPHLLTLPLRYQNLDFQRILE